jgi:TetR/AcrR family transcriptional regulator, cholesterol catabolism regulator
MASPVRSLEADKSGPAKPANGLRFRQQLGKILEGATAVFCEKGYEGASMRDIARQTGLSLAGMYHYFGSKERLLYLIQKHSFSTIVDRLRASLAHASGAEEGIHAFIQNHLEYFLAHPQAMKVLSHEDEVLTGEYGRQIAQLKREYYHLCRELLNRYKKEKGLQFDSRMAILSLFGMMNWIYTWYNPRLDGDAERLAAEMGNLFFGGIAGRKTLHSRYSQRKRANRIARQPAAARRGSFSFA